MLSFIFENCIRFSWKIISMNIITGCEMESNIKCGCGTNAYWP